MLEDGLPVDGVRHDGRRGAAARPRPLVVTRVLDFGYDVQRAIEAPRWLYGRTWGTESAALSVEEDIGAGRCRALAAMGHDVRWCPPGATRWAMRRRSRSTASAA